MDDARTPARALAMAGGAVAQDRRPCPRRTPRCAPPRGRTGRAAPSPSPSTATMRPTSCATAASRSGGCAGASTAAGSACRASSRSLGRYGRQGDLLRPRRRRPAPPRGAAPGDRRRPRDRHPWLDPRAQLGAALRRRARPHASRSAETLEKADRGASGRHAHAASWGFQPDTRSPSRRRWDLLYLTAR